MNEFLLVFLAQIVYVFMLGFQSRNVRDGQYLAASLTSLGIGVSSLAIQPLIVKAVIIEPQPIVIVGFLLGGPIGICLAMFAHDRMRDYGSR